ncbi:hypothetical protein GCM10009665_60410 [Kitasatospora nipponensis]|uniref:Uncharacterized protein n=1 Tax=Kitasatospora nipponensis TaxID=258049 RepID=A0ABP4HF07_9ACTN
MTTSHLPHPTAAAPAPARLRYPLLLGAAGLLLSGFAIWADGHFVDDVLRHCRNSAGLPVSGVVAAWAGLAAGLLAVLWLGRHLVTRRIAPRARAAVGVLLAVSVLPLLVQGIAVTSALHDSGPRPSPCFGLAAPRS